MPSCPEGARSGAVFDHYAARFPGLRDMERSILLARNQEFAGLRTPWLDEGDEIALLPPVSGGSNRHLKSPRPGHSSP